jgi:hypothetical protein
VVPQVTAQLDPALTARIIRTTPLFYDDEPPAEFERPPYVRAGSSLACIADYVVVVQDNTNFVALIDIKQRRATSLALPGDAEGDRVFDADHGNKRHKFDLEACLVVPHEGASLLVAFGSGTSAERERIVVVFWRDGQQRETRVFDGASFYHVLREAHDFSGSELNVEGAVYLNNDQIRLFQRGNGAAHDDLQPVDATCDIAWSELWTHLQQLDTPPPQPHNIVQYHLGELRGHPLNFSDAELVSDVILYSASAEGSAEAGSDGEITGSVIGLIDANGARYTQLLAEDGQQFNAKIEGISVGNDDRHLVYFVVDDDNDEPSALFEVELIGPWYRDSA